MFFIYINVGLLIKELDKQKPVIITGYSEKTGHCWIIDGYRREKTEYEMVCYCEYTSDWISTDEVFDTFEQASRKYGFESAEDIRPYPNQVTVEYYLLMNWGDDGRGSGSSYTSLAPWYFAKKNMIATLRFFMISDEEILSSNHCCSGCDS